VLKEVADRSVSWKKQKLDDERWSSKDYSLVEASWKGSGGTVTMQFIAEKKGDEFYLLGSTIAGDWYDADDSLTSIIQAYNDSISSLDSNKPLDSAKKYTVYSDSMVTFEETLANYDCVISTEWLKYTGDDGNTIITLAATVDTETFFTSDYEYYLTEIIADDSSFFGWSKNNKNGDQSSEIKQLIEVSSMNAYYKAEKLRVEDSEVQQKIYDLQNIMGRFYRGEEESVKIKREAEEQMKYEKLIAEKNRINDDMSSDQQSIFDFNFEDSTVTLCIDFKNIENHYIPAVQYGSVTIKVDNLNTPKIDLSLTDGNLLYLVYNQKVPNIMNSWVN